MPPSIADILEQSRRELLDLSLRNRLLSIPSKAQSARVLHIHDELSEQIFRLLVEDKKSLSFLPAPQSVQVDAEQNGSSVEHSGFALPQPEDEEDSETGLAKRHIDLRLQTSLSSERLQQRLLGLYRDAQTMLEEQGINILFLSLGQLKWFESPDSDTARLAPLILVPVELKRKSASDRFHLVWKEGDVEENLSLEAKLKADFGLTLPAFPADEELSPNQYFAEVSACISGMKRWEVLPNAITLGFFSFAKFLMYRDLDAATWPSPEKLLAHPLIAGLLQDGFPRTDAFFAENKDLDSLIPVSRLDHVVDADSSQTVAIELVRQGRNLVIQGPPGTGKSQSITNIIATAVLDGKKVLFVAEKMAALEVVKRRLEKEGLGSLCLELHSDKSNKRAVIEEIGRTWKLGRPKATDLESLVPKLEQCRGALNEHVQILHQPLSPSQISPFIAMAHLTSIGNRANEVADLTFTKAENWIPEARTDNKTVIEELADRIVQIGLPSRHPWRGVTRTNLLHIDLPPMERDIRALAKGLLEVNQSVTALAKSLACPCPRTISDARALVLVGQHVASAPTLDKQAICHSVWTIGIESVKQLVAQGRQHSAAITKLRLSVTEETWNEDFSKARRDMGVHGQSWFRVFSGDYRRAVAQLRGALNQDAPKQHEARLALLDDIIGAQRALRTIRRSDELGRSAFGVLWRQEATDWLQAAAIIDWVARQSDAGLDESFRKLFAAVPEPKHVATSVTDLSSNLTSAFAAASRLADAFKLDFRCAFGVVSLGDIPMQDLAERCDAWLSNMEGLIKWSQYTSRADAARQAGLEGLVGRLETGIVSSETAAEAFDRVYYGQLLRDFVRRHPSLIQFEGSLHSRRVEDFGRMDTARLALSKHRTLLNHFEHLPITSGTGMAGIMMGEIERKRAHRPVRRLLKDCGSIVQSIKPVFMMSPLSVAQFLEAGSLEFDLLIIDEASQVQPVDALGAIARCKQVVVVGDTKQLPPTRFFSRMTTDVDDTDQDTSDDQSVAPKDVESILGLCCARGIPQTTLRWHYRSRHHSLIAVSNQEFYDNGLFIVPSPEVDSDDKGVHFTFVPNGVFDTGASGTNRVEAKHVAEAVIAHARKHPHRSLGVVAFSVRQRQAILDELEHLRRAHPDVESFFTAHPTEPMFVKNLENVQGDERDVIFISVGYGKNTQGYMAMRFGPLSSDGGERRLNVLISRAKHKCQVFSSITAEDIDLERASGRGVASLKTFLTFAKTKRLAIAQRSGLLEQSPFEEAVRRALESTLESNLYEVHPQVGIAGFFIDLAVVDTQQRGRYVLGIECDGATYHSSRSARDRDRLRQAVLEDHGWTIHRIWSTDWFQRPSEQLRKVLDAIERAKAKVTHDPQGSVSSNDKVTAHTQDVIERESPKQNGSENGLDSLSDPYQEAWFSVPCDKPPHEVSTKDMAAIVLRILEQEAPVHQDEVVTRVRTLWKLGRAGNRIQQAVTDGLDRLIRSSQCVREDQYFLNLPGRSPHVRRRDGVLSASLRKPEMLPPSEIRVAICNLLRANHGAEIEEIRVPVARMFGMKNASSQIRDLITEQVTHLLRKGTVTQQDRVFKLLAL